MSSSFQNTCFICNELYNFQERKPLLLPCSHTCCKSCLQQIKTTNNGFCPVCRESWVHLSVDTLPFVRQLVYSPEKVNTKVHPTQYKNVCIVHNDYYQIAWCKICGVSICFHCLKTDHKLCDWVSIDEKAASLFCDLEKSVTSTRTQINEKFSQLTIEVNSIVADVRNNIKKLQKYEMVALSFLQKLLTKKDMALRALKECEDISSNSSVTEMIIAISKTSSILDDHISVPIIPKLTILDCEEPTDETDMDIDSTDSSDSGMVIF